MGPYTLESCTEWVDDTVVRCGMQKGHAGKHQVARSDDPVNWDRVRAKARMRVRRKGHRLDTDIARDEAYASLARKYPAEYLVLYRQSLGRFRNLPTTPLIATEGFDTGSSESSGSNGPITSPTASPSLTSSP